MNWTETNSFLRGIMNTMEELHDPVRIASFDLDDTIIHRPTSRKGSQKWKLLDGNISKKIAKLIENGFIIIFFTNQSSMGTSKTFDKNSWRKAMNDLTKILFSEIGQENYYFAIYVAKKYDLYRKPNIGMWQQMKLDLKDEFDVDNGIRISKKSFFCGDAAGRVRPGQFKKKMHPTSNKGDHSDTDRKFALNIGINFLTPEEFYLKNAPVIQYTLSGVDPKQLIKTVIDSSYVFEPRKKEMIIMVGLPGAGKTEFVKKYILPEKYVHINRDTCKSKTKCLDLTKKALEKKKSVVIDNTNPDVLSRMEYTLLAQEYGYHHIRAIIMNTEVSIAKHLNNVRHVYSNGTIPKINNITYNIFKKKYVKPHKSEHFDEIEIVDFVFEPEYLDDPLWKKIFLKWSEF